MMMFFGGSSLFAATEYNTNITNQASLSFSVGGQVQPAQSSNTDTFKVDRKVDMTIATSDSSNVIVNPGDNVASSAQQDL